jgi:hypothetical protein
MFWGREVKQFQLFVCSKPRNRKVTHSWSWVLEKLPIVQLLKNFPTFDETRRFITVFTRALHWSLSWARSIHPIPFYFSKIHFNIMHPLRLGLPSGLFPFGFPTNIVYALLPYSCYMHCPSHPFFLFLIYTFYVHSRHDNATDIILENFVAQ